MDDRSWEDRFQGRQEWDGERCKLEEMLSASYQGPEATWPFGNLLGHTPWSCFCLPLELCTQLSWPGGPLRIPYRDVVPDCETTDYFLESPTNQCYIKFQSSDPVPQTLILRAGIPMLPVGFPVRFANWKFFFSLWFVSALSMKQWLNGACERDMASSTPAKIPLLWRFFRWPNYPGW